MSNIRQPINIDPAGELDDPSRPVIAVAHDRPEAFEVPPHEHLRAQLVYATNGVMRVSTDDATWIVPPQQAVWVPPGVTHSVVNESKVAFRTLYLHPEVVAGLPDRCCVISVSPLLRELILYATTLGDDESEHHLQASLLSVTPALLATLKVEPLQLPLPKDRRLQMITDTLMDEPADRRALSDWAKQVGASERTLERLFQKELAMNYSQWRQRRRLLSAISRLSEGTPVTTTAYELGYASPSAFIAMFRRELGHPPGRYLRTRKSLKG